MAEARQRIDKWLWHARVVKTRSAAARLVQDGYVRINGTRFASAAKAVAIGDVLTVALERQVRVLRLRGIADRRGPYREAALLFEEIDTREPAVPGPPEPSPALLAMPDESA